MSTSQGASPGYSPISTVHSEKSLATIPLSSDTDVVINKESSVPYIILSVLIIIFILLNTVFVLYRRHIKRSRQTTQRSQYSRVRIQSSQDNYAAINETDIMKK